MLASTVQFSNNNQHPHPTPHKERQSKRPGNQKKPTQPLPAQTEIHTKRRSGSVSSGPNSVPTPAPHPNPAFPLQHPPCKQKKDADGTTRVAQAT
jgi:hypothetical protein